MQEESTLNGMSGYVALPFVAFLQVIFPVIFVRGLLTATITLIAIGAIGTLFVAACWKFAFFLVHPNEAKVLQLFGRYVGTAKLPGLRFANPFHSKQVVSLRVRNFESGKLKVNEAGGSPIEIATIVVWQVVDTAEAAFEVDNFEEFVTIQSEAALRNLATRFPYETHDNAQLALHSNSKEIADALRKETQARVDKAGVHVVEARISHQAYAPEIASAMLR
jgi:regulator of protease activity HflC (stomatin/prohibitin superfamily)